MVATSPLWQRTDEPALVFHHAMPDSAEEIASSGRFRVGTGNLFGSGLYAGEDDPVGRDRDWINRRYFFGVWPPEGLGGAVVLLRDDERQPFVSVSETPSWYLPHPPGVVRIADLVVGWGQLQADGSWWWSPGLLL